MGDSDGSFFDNSCTDFVLFVNISLNIFIMFHVLSSSCLNYLVFIITLVIILFYFYHSWELAPKVVIMTVTFS